MNIGLLVSLGFGTLLVLIVAMFVYRRVPKKLKVEQYIGDWKELQAYCRDKTTWPQAIIDADKLLDKALKRRKFRGKRMGERMVSAQRMITDNDRLWFAHNLAKKVIADPKLRLKEGDVKAALIGFRQALKDIGALQTTDQTPAVEPEGVKK
jgi:hypothetical protein